MAFHEYGGPDTSGVFISLPQWVLEIGKSNQDIFFTDREGRRNTECLSWGIDKERVLKGRTGIEVISFYFIHLCLQDEWMMVHGIFKLLGYYVPAILVSRWQLCFNSVLASGL